MMVRYTGSPGRVHGGDAGGAGTCTWQATSPITRAHEYDALGRLALFTDKQLQVVAWTPVYVEDPYGDCPGCLILVDSTPTYDEVTLASASYAYDAVGNRAGAGVTVGTGNRLTAQGGWTITYDSVGNMTSRTAGSETLTYKWNALGQLDTVVAPGYTVTYGYDGLGRRVRKTVNGVATRYLVEGDRVLAELDNSWGVAATYAYRPGVDRPLAMQRGGATYYYTQDAQGNVTGLLNATGSVVQQYHYTPYGEAQAGYGTIVNPYQYKGREWDAEARLHYMRARYYDPQLGRFLSEDPLGLAGGINPTAFVGGDPVNYSDPSGECRRYAAQYIDYVPRPGAPAGELPAVKVTAGYIWLGCEPMSTLRDGNMGIFDARAADGRDLPSEDWFRLPGAPGLLENPYLDEHRPKPRVSVDLPTNPCDVYSDNSWWTKGIGFSCRQVSDGRRNRGTAECLAYQWLRLEYELGRAPKKLESWNYLTIGHTSCYSATGYEKKQFLFEFLFTPVPRR